MAPVSGTVTAKKLPLKAGQVTFHPVGKTEGSGGTGFSGGTIDATGKYDIFTGGTKGAPLGKYKVTVNPAMMPSTSGAPPVGFNPKYKDAKLTPLEFEVIADPAPGRYDLKLDK
jgi:hypothetical protein